MLVESFLRIDVLQHYTADYSSSGHLCLTRLKDKSSEYRNEFIIKMAECGITAILNFAPCKLNVPDGVILENENLALSLAYLNNQIK